MDYAFRIWCINYIFNRLMLIFIVLRLGLFIVTIIGFFSVISVNLILTGIGSISEILSILYNLYYTYLNIQMTNNKMNLSIHSSGNALDLNDLYPKILNPIKTSSAQSNINNLTNSQISNQGPNTTHSSLTKIMKLSDVQRITLKYLYNLKPKGSYFEMVDLSSYYRTVHTGVVSYTPLDQHQHDLISGINYNKYPNPHNFSCRYYITIYNYLNYYYRPVTVQDLFMTFNREDYFFKIKTLYESGNLRGYTARWDDNIFNPFVVYPNYHPLFDQFYAIHDYNKTLDLVTEYADFASEPEYIQNQNPTGTASSNTIVHQ
jgi:hypothetical protein